jgi:hypothetical protein
MYKRFAVPLALAALLALGLSASAQISYGPGAGGAIPDGTGSPVVPGVLTTDIVLTDTHVIAAFDGVFLSFNPGHTWVGDLKASLTKVGSGITVDLVNRLGVTTDNTVGDSSNLASSGEYGFKDTGASFLTAAGGGTTAFVIPTGTYARSTIDAFVATAANPVNNTALSAFNGTSLDGTWRLTISDSAAIDTGSLASWRFTAAPVPGPSSVAVLAMGLAGLPALRFARRRKKA